MSRAPISDGTVQTSRAVFAVVLALLLIAGPAGVAAAVPDGGPTESTEPAVAGTAATGEIDAPAAVGGRLSATSPDDVSADKRLAVRRSSADGDEATITGRVLYRSGDGDYEPARQVRVVVRDKDVVVKGVHASTRTDDEGRFTLSFDPDPSGWGDDPDWGSTATVVVQAYADNPAAKTTRGAFRKRYRVASAKLTVRRGETRRLGRLAPSGDANEAFLAADWVLSAHRKIAAQSDGWGRKQVRIQYPRGNWPRAPPVPGFKGIKLPARSSFDWDRRILYHEYGHTVMDGLYEFRAVKWPIPKVKNWCSPHTYTSESDRSYAWIEGWAIFVETALYDDEFSDSVLEERVFYQSSGGGGCFGSDRGNMDGATVEGSVAGLLWDLYDGGTGDDDGLDYSMGTLVRTIDDNDVGNVLELYDELRTEANRDELAAVYAEHGVPKHDRFEPNDDRASAATAPDAARFLTLETGDSDVFVRDLSAGERLSVNVTHDANESGLGVSVHGPGGVVETAPKLFYGDEARHPVEVTASEAGRYYVVVNGSGDTVTYDLSTSVTTTRRNDRSGPALDGVGFDRPVPGLPAAGPDSGVECGDDVRRFEGSVTAGDGRQFAAALDAECDVRVTLVAAGGADLDLFATADGRAPTTADYDRNAITAASAETLTIGADARSVDDVGVLVHAYSGSGEFTLVVEEVEQDD